MTAPDFIWAYNERQLGYSFTAKGPQPHFAGVEFVRRDPAVLAELPEVKALVAAAVMDAAWVAERYGPDRPMVETPPRERIRGRWEGEQAASANIASLIRSSAPDAKTALDRMLQEREQRARNDALREAAEEADSEGWPSIMTSNDYASLTDIDEAAMDCGTRIAAAIRALIQEPKP